MSSGQVSGVHAVPAQIVKMADRLLALSKDADTFGTLTWETGRWIVRVERTASTGPSATFLRGRGGS